MPNFPNQYFPPKPNTVPPNHAPGIREMLLRYQGYGDEFDRHVISCVLANAMAELEFHPITEALALTKETLTVLIQTMFPGSIDVDKLIPEDATTGQDALAEPLLREMLISYGTNGLPIESWLAAIFIRRCQVGDHMWRSIGLFSRDELTKAMFRYFKPLAVKNIQDIRWKRFIYKQMRIESNQSLDKYPYCESCNRFIVMTDEEGKLSKYPFCDHCPDFEECSATEEY